MRTLLLLVAFAAVASAWPQLNCAQYACTGGWTHKNYPPASSIACLAGVCTNRVCCNPPTCAAFVSAGSCTLKDNAGAIQCRGEVPSGCTTDLCCKSSSPIPPPCSSSQLYYTDFIHSERVNTIQIAVDSQGVHFVDGSQRVISSPGGADGILVNPKNNSELFVGAQQTRIFIIDTTNPDVNNNWNRQLSPSDVFNVKNLNDENVLGFTHNGAQTFTRFHLVGNTLPDQGLGTAVTLTGYVTNVTAVVRLPGNKYLWIGGSDFGEPKGVGFITFDATFDNAVLSPPHFVAPSHSGTYDAYTNTVFVWGGKTITQFDLAGNFMSSFDATALIGTGGSAGFQHLDNGDVDGRGILYIAANNGMLLWFDLRVSRSIGAPDNSGSYRVMPGDGLDAVTAPVCNR